MMTVIKLYLDSIDPRLWPVAIAAVVWGLVYAWRRLHPSSFEKVSPGWQALPAVLVGIALSASTATDALSGMREAALGVFSGWMAAGGHDFLKRLPGPYKGGK